MFVTDSQLQYLVRQDIYSRMYMAKHVLPRKAYNDSLASLPRASRKRIRRLADMAIRYHDAKYNDFIGLALFKSVFLYFVLPWVVDFAKGIVASGLTASVKQRFIDPILDKIIGSGKALLQKKGDEAQTEAICRNIKENLGKLVDVLKREGSFVAGKAMALFSKIKGVFK